MPSDPSTNVYVKSPIVNILPFQPSPYESTILIVASEGICSIQELNGAPPSIKTLSSQSIIDHEISSCH